LPDIDGYEVLRRLREPPHASGPFVAAVTGFGQPEDPRRTPGGWFDHHLVKPFGPDVLMKISSRSDENSVLRALHDLPETYGLRDVLDAHHCAPRRKLQRYANVFLS
jgi:CheY-like chemotaxis protein